MTDTSEFLASVKVEGDNPFAELDKQVDTPAESLPEKVEVKEEPTQGEETIKEPIVNTENEDTPFHKRWKVREDKLKNELEERFQQELEQTRQQLEQKFTPKQSEQQTIPRWFANLYGENPEAWTEYQEYDVSRKAEIKQEIIREQQEAAQHQEQEIKYWDKWVDTEINNLVAGVNFDPKDKNELINVILKYKPTDANNQYDFMAGYELMQLERVKNQSTQAVEVDKKQARKVIADGTTKPSQGESRKQDYQTPATLRGKTWNNL
mgnify:CR=1 FL=1